MKKFIILIGLLLFLNVAAFPQRPAQIRMGVTVPTICSSSSSQQALFYKISTPTGLYQCVSGSYVLIGGGGGGGITNSAPNNTFPLSNGTNIITSPLSDNGSTVSITRTFTDSSLYKVFNAKQTGGNELFKIEVFPFFNASDVNQPQHSLYIGSRFPTNRTGKFNILIGGNTFTQSTTFSGNSNTGTGTDSLSSITTADAAAAFGYSSLNGLTTGVRNSAFGAFALQFTTTGGYQSAFGYKAGQNNVGSYNSFFGHESGYNNTAGSSNSFYGNRSGNGSIASFSSYFGHHSGNSANSSYSVFLGAFSGEGETNDYRLRIGVTGVLTDDLIYGEFDNKLVSVRGRLTANAQSISTVPLTTNGFTGHTDNLFEAKIAGGSALFAIDKFGAAHLPDGLSDGGLVFGTKTGSYGGRMWRNGGAYLGIGMPAGGGLFIYTDNGTAVYQFTVADFSSSLPVKVPASAYGAGWNGLTSVATQGDLYDKFEQISGGGSALASAATLPAPTKRVHHVTGTTTITNISATGVPVGHVTTLIFDDSVTVTDGGNMKLLQTYAAFATDTLTLIWDGTNWYQIGYSENSLL